MKKPAPAVPAVFTFESAYPVRIIDIGGEPWFVAVDVCGVLGIQNATQAVGRLDPDERAMFNIGRQGKAAVVSESGLYTLVMRCRDAVKAGSIPHKFRKWVTSEVLPSIRKHGFYAVAAKPPARYTDSHVGGEKLTAQDMANLRRAVWRISVGGAGGEEAWTRAVWAALRKAVGRRDVLLVDHLPVLGDVLRRAARLSDAASTVASHVGAAAMRALVDGGPDDQVKVPPLNVAKEASKLSWWTEREVERLLTRGEPIMDHPEAGEPA
ncbi:hypothetical protein LJB71_08445 [Thermomonas sp. S9]|uniref:BRO-N domain-containing protein n=1 Tax=Thermomonas sp. S9 TaxID=2885203 RepID=UPI00216AD3C1|nr:BRO family protein [Thermomonas sp. S9]MCR6496244.1 hypothetical protein [Thermomonas sp. S9]